MRETHWLRDLRRADEPQRRADEITAARALNAVLLERHQARAAVDHRGSRRLTQVYDDVSIAGYGEPLTDEIVDARVARTPGSDNDRWNIDRVVDRLRLDHHQRDLLRSNSDVMVKVLGTYGADSRRITWADLRGMTPRELYVLMEQDGNPDRPVRNPIALSYQGCADHHPYIGRRRVVVYRTTDAVTTIRSHASDHDTPSGLLLVHPQSERTFPIRGLEPHKELLPTTSVRTLYDPDDDLHYKLSFDAQITSHTRVLHRHEAANAIAASNLLLALAGRGALPSGLFFLPELSWSSHPSSPLANCLVRGGIRDIVPEVPAGARVIAMSSLTTPLSFARSRSFFELMCRHTTAARLFEEIVNALVSTYLGLVDLGISHESHAQNTLLVVDLEELRVHGICLRDVEAMKIDPARHRELEVPLFHSLHGTQATRSQALLDPCQPDLRRYLMTAFFTHCIIDSQISCLATVLLDTGLMAQTDIVEVTWRAIRQCCEQLPYANDNLLRTFYRRNLAHKGLGLPIGDPYRTVDNLLYP